MTNKTTAVMLMMAATLLPPPIVARAQKSIPYEETFDTQDSFADFITIDGDGSGKSWSYISWNQDVRSSFNLDRSTSDWLLTPELSLEGDRTYNLSFDAFNCIASTTEKLEVLFGEGTDTADYTTVLIPTTAINQEKANAIRLSAVINPSKSGNYRIAFHAVSDPDHFWVGIDNISVTQNALNVAPGQVTNLKVEPDAYGLLKAKVSFNAPQLDGAGAKLTALSKIEVVRDSTLLNSLTINSPEPGKEYTLTDENVDSTGLHTYRVRAYNENGVGLEASATEFIGQGVPQAPSAVHITDNGGGATVSWQAPSTEGVEGRYVRVDELTYNIYDPNGNKVGSVDGATSWQLPDDVYYDEDQSYHWYNVKAQTPAGEGVAAPSSYIVTGDPYELPFRESWREGRADDYHLWWSPVDFSDRFNDGFGLSSKSVDDGYSQSWYTTKSGQTTELGSGKISLYGTTNPHLIFSYYAYPGKDVVLTVIADDGTEDSVELGKVDYSLLTGEEGWRKADFDLSQLVNTDYVVLRFCPAEESLGTTVNLDRICVRDVHDKNMSIYSITGPAKGKIGEDVTISGRLWNTGATTATGYNVCLYVNGNLYSQKEGQALDADGEGDFSFTYKPLVTDPEDTKVFVKVDYPGDADLSDNTSDTLAITLDQPDYPTVTNLTANVQGSATTLSWTAPEIDNSAKTDDFESYEPWSRSNVGKWTIVDGDRAYTYGLNDYEFPNSGDRIGFMVFNPSDAGIEANASNGLAPHSGKQAMASFSLRDNSEPVDDWLISPELSALSQTITFWAKSQTSLLPETIEVKYSETATDTASFTHKFASVVVPETWTKYTYNLPEGSKYFAIHSMASNNYMLMVDDATFQRVLLVLSGYGIYRDGKLVDTVDGTETTYTDNIADGGSHVYQVSAIYTIGESKLSDVAVISGIKSVSGKANVLANGNVYTLDGRFLGTKAIVDRLPKGVYIIGNRKFIVK